MKIKKILYLLPLLLLILTMPVYALDEEDNLSLDETKNLVCKDGVDSDFDPCSSIRLGAYQRSSSNQYQVNIDYYNVFYKNGNPAYGKFTMLGNNDSLGSFLYGMLASNLNFDYKNNTKYEFERVFEIDDDIDFENYTSSIITDDNFTIAISDKTLGTRFLNKNNFDEYFNDVRFFIVEDTENKKKGRFVKAYFQFETNSTFTEKVDILSYMGFRPTLPDTDEFPGVDNINTILATNFTNKTRYITYYGYLNREVETFSFYSENGDLPEVFDFDKDSNSDTEIFEALAVCDATDIVCHLRNLVDLIKRFFVRVGNLLKSIFNVIKNLVNLLIKALQKMFEYLFVPPSQYFENRFNYFKSQVETKLGILYFPLDLLFSFLDRFNNMSNSSSGVINIPNISIPGFGTLIQAQSFSINENWNKEPFSTLYNIYLAFVHCFIGFCLYKLALKKEKEIVGGGV